VRLVEGEIVLRSEEVTGLHTYREPVAIELAKLGNETTEWL
jgi:hypothetical protein